MSDRALRTATLAVTAIFVLATAMGVGGLVQTRAATAFGATTTLTVVGGHVTVSRDGVTFASASDGDVLRAGTTVRTSADGYAVITYFDGSTVSIDPSTTLTISALGVDPDGTRTILMRQEIGRTWHVVQKLLSSSSRYEVTTPVMTASVRGTMFALTVTTDAQEAPVSVLDTVEGTVAATTSGPPPQEVLVPAGFRATATRSTIAPAVPIPAPDRTITVTMGASAGVVIDDAGRSNGFLDDRIVAQTPGVRIERRGRELVVRLPSAPRKVVVVARTERQGSGAVGLFTDVEEQGRATRTVRQRIPTDGSGHAVASVEIGGAAGPTVTTPATDDEKKALAARVNVGGGKKEGDTSKKADDGGQGPGGPGGLALDPQLPPLPFGGLRGGDRSSGLVPQLSLPLIPSADRSPSGGKDPIDKREDRSSEGTSAGATNTSKSGDAVGFVPSAPLPEIPTLSGPASKDPTPRSDGPQPATDRSGTDRSGPDTRSGSDGGGGKDTKGRP